MNRIKGGFRALLLAWLRGRMDDAGEAVAPVNPKRPRKRMARRRRR